MAQKEFRPHLTGAKLAGQMLQGALSLGGWHAELQLFFETLGCLTPQSGGGRTIQQSLLPGRPLRQAHVFFRGAMHPHQDAHTVVIVAVEAGGHDVGQPAPATQVEIADAAIG